MRRLTIWRGTRLLLYLKNTVHNQITHMKKLNYYAPITEQFTFFELSSLLLSGSGNGTGDDLDDPVVPGGSFDDLFNIL